MVVEINIFKFNWLELGLFFIIVYDDFVFIRRVYWWIDREVCF